MCDVAERLEKMGIEKGIEIGRSEGEIKEKCWCIKICVRKDLTRKKPEDLRSCQKI